MLVSCLCVTENRPAFMEWLLWNYERQSWPERELVIVDSSADEPSAESAGEGRDDVRVVALRPGVSVAEKRNVALQEARGEFVTWFDDDDWQHPDKIAVLVDALADGAVFAGSRRGWFVNLRSLWCQQYCGESPIVLLPTMMGRREAVAEVDFVEDRTYAVDTAWLWELRLAYGSRSVILEREDLSFWLCHERNSYNTADRWIFDQRLDALRAVIGAEAWGDTDAALEEVRTRIGRIC